MKVELIYDSACRNVEAARTVIAEAFAKAGLPAHWQEWNKDSKVAPDYARFYGSPTILMNGRDVGGMEPNPNADCCRIYLDHNDKRVPSVEDLIAVLRQK